MKLSSCLKTGLCNSPGTSLYFHNIYQVQYNQPINFGLLTMSQRQQVVTLYKTLLHLGKDWPAGYELFRTKLHKAFIKNKDVTDPEKIQKLITHGEYIVKEIEALYMLKKYRTLKRRYYQ
ncbi:hypothetical protein RN001_002548 [Aquatica leii]|uniref:Complex 1 LYR protein domain-containing protein n=1 Tax=Aquatica leii TaxID=1421715 RepID=A0AAN7SK79_9COLE|nr:hypothetical protein RN001_002548 [Aquatica leii]